MANGLPELNTNYGPDLGKTMMSVAAYKNATTQNAMAQLGLSQQLGAMNAMQNVDWNSPTALQDATRSLMPINPTMGMNMMGSLATMQKAGAEIQKNQAEATKSNIESAHQLIGFVRSYPESYPQVYQKMSATGVPGLPDPSTFGFGTGNVDVNALHSYLDTTAEKLASYEQQLKAGTPELKELPTATGLSQPVTVIPGKGTAGIKPYGPPVPTEKSEKTRATYLESLKAQGIDIGQENESWLQGHYKVQTAPQTARGQQAGEQKFVRYIDTANSNTVGSMNANQYNQANKVEPNRYVELTPQVETALQQKAIMGEMRMGTDALKKSMTGLKSQLTPEVQAQLALIDKATDKSSAWQNFFQGQAARTLSKDQIDYLTDVKRLQEYAMSLRSLAKMGQGSESQRAAIEATVPGAALPIELNRSRLEKFEQQLDQVEKGIVGLPQPTKAKIIVNQKTGERRGWNPINQVWEPLAQKGI